MLTMTFLSLMALAAPAENSPRAPANSPAGRTFARPTAAPRLQPSAGATTVVNEAEAVLQGCQVLLVDDVDVPALETGPLISVAVKEGDFVQADSLMAQIDDRQAVLQRESSQADLQAAQAKASDDIDVRFAQKSFEVAVAELRQDLEIKSKAVSAVTDSEIRRKELVKTREQLGIDRAKLDRRVAELTAQAKAVAVQQAEETILRRRLLAPFDGLVVDVYKHSSEWVNAGEPVLRVVRLDRLRVEGFLHGAEIDPTEVAGRPVAVEVELARGRRESFSGQIVFVSPLTQAGNKFRLRAEVANRFDGQEPLLRPGMTARMVISLR